MKNDFFDITQV